MSIDRRTCLQIINAARVVGRADFARRLAMEWLTRWPGDLAVRHLLALCELDLGLVDAATERLRQLVETDPGATEVYRDLARALTQRGDSLRAQQLEFCASLLTGAEVPGEGAPTWVPSLSRAWQALRQGEAAEAVACSQEALAANPSLPLPAWVAVQAHLLAGDRQAAASLAQAAAERWPTCVLFRALLAQEAIARGRVSEGVARLQDLVADDLTGERAAMVLGAGHPYRNLWPQDPHLEPSEPLPAEVARYLGRNRLPTPAAAEPAAKTEPEGNAEPAQAQEDLPQPMPWEAFRGPDAGEPKAERPPEESEPDEVQALLNRLTARLTGSSRPIDEDKRAPAYVVLANRSRLLQTFGQDGFQWLDEVLHSLVAAVARRPGWTAYLLYADDPESTARYGLTPAEPGNAWQIKLRLADLDRWLAGRGEMIGALLIVGGHEIVPFHMLPNPTDDADDVVPSDNPYAARDENYFAPEWPVGRLPLSDDLALLVRLVKEAALYHQAILQPLPPLLRLRRWLLRRLERFIWRHPRAWGYSASVWRRASLAVFRAVGEPRALLTSPPVVAGRLPPYILRPVRYTYFNLHGLEDAPEWFGQSDPLRDGGRGPLFPVALRPADVVNSGRAPRIVFTEACYGANVLGKTVESALCLKFLASGSRAVVGSTKIAYGSVTPPLVAADLLGRLFWEHLAQGYPAGEALRRAKLGLAAEMHRRQGLLDGEDQKALISFVLYGDPLYAPEATPPRPGQKTIMRRKTRPRRMKVACALDEASEGESAPDRATVKALVERYLPGMEDADCRVHPQHCGCQAEDHLCPTGQLGLPPEPEPKTFVVTLSKTLVDGSHQHRHYARLTVDREGKVLKLAVSR